MEKACIFCKRTTDDSVSYGELRHTKKTYAHHYCALTATGITKSADESEGIFGYMYKDIKAVVDKCKSTRCHYCNKKGAAIRCFEPKCKKNFHYPCGLERNCSFSFGKRYETFCRQHNHYPEIIPEIIENLTNMECVICFGAVKDINKVADYFVTPCCGVYLMHTKCAKYLAIYAGTSIRCPVCDDTEEFIDGLKHRGVYVPLVDDSSSENSSDEERESKPEDPEMCQMHCNVTNCTSPKGKALNTKWGPWKLIPCRDCGCYSAHIGCVKYGSYLCETCGIVEELSNNCKTDDVVDEKETSLYTVEGICLMISTCFLVVFVAIAAVYFLFK